MTKLIKLPPVKPVHISFTLPEDVLARFNAMVNAGGISRNQILRALVEDAVTEHEEKASNDQD